MKNLFKRIEKVMVAATFAEAGEPQMALEFLQDRTRPQARRRVEPRVDRPRPRPELRAPSWED